MKLFILSIFYATLCLFTNAQQKKQSSAAGTSKTAVQFDKYIEYALQTWKTPGLSVAVVKDGKVVFKKGYGIKELGKPDSYTTATLSTCASTTKAMTAVCMAMLVDEGKVKWTDIVSDILPQFKIADPYVTSQITILDLFTHNAGLGNADMLWVYGYSREEILSRMKFLSPAYSLRAGFIYQNLMYLVAGEVIKKISSRTWDEFITERLFQPLNMTHTYADYSKVPNAEKTGLHFKDNDTIKIIKYTDGDNIGAAGGVWSCADDITKWMQFLQDSARVNGKQLLKPATFAELFKPHAMVSDDQFYPTKELTKPHWKTYGLGWFQQDYRGKMVQYHTGSLAGLVAIHGMIPEQNLSIYIFGNLDHTEIRHALMFKAFDMWSFNDTTKNWSADFYKLYKGLSDTAKARERDAISKRVLNTRPSIALKAYTGKYSNETYGNAEVVIDKDSLSIILPNQYTLYLKHWNFDTFEGQFDYWWFGKTAVQFILDADGTVSGVSLDGTLYKKENPE